MLPGRFSKNPALLKRRVGNGCVYVRPIQRDLNLSDDDGEESDQVCIIRP